MQYSTLIACTFFKICSMGDTPEPPFGAVTQNQAPSLQNPGCAPAYN